MVSNEITSDELNQFRSLPFKKKADSMELYLIGDGGRYNMQEVATRVFGHENYSFTVSLIHRCYNFSGQNGGRYCNGCAFEKKYGYRVTRKDIEAFLKKYPSGTYSRGITFEDFLKTRINSSSNKTVTPTASFQRQPAQTTSYSTPQTYYNNIQTPWNGGGISQQEEPNRKAIIVGSIGIGILLVMLLSGNLFEHWIISIIILIITIVSFYLSKKI